jgi:hypothetical protein
MDDAAAAKSPVHKAAGTGTGYGTGTGMGTGTGSTFALREPPQAWIQDKIMANDILKFFWFFYDSPDYYLFACTFTIIGYVLSLLLLRK